MYSRAPRSFECILGSTPLQVGPGTYNPANVDTKKHANGWSASS